MPDDITINEWRGNATDTAQIIAITVNSAVSGALYGVDVAGRAARYRATDADDINAIATALATALAGGPYNVSTALNVITLTGTEAGVAFASGLQVLKTPACWVERTQLGKVPVSQELTITIPAGATGGTWALSCNFGAGVETAAGLAKDITAEDLLTALLALATPGDGDLSVQLVSTDPRTFRIKVQGALAGTTVSMTSDASGLTGLASATVNRVQFAGSNTPAIWALSINRYYDNVMTQTLTIDGVTQEMPGNTDLASATWWQSKLGVSLTAIASYKAPGITPGNDMFYVVISVLSDKEIAVSEYTTTSCVRVQQAFTTPNHCWQFVPGYNGSARTATFSGQTTTSFGVSGLIIDRLAALSNVGGAGNVDGFYFSYPSTYVPVLIRWKGTLGSATQPLVTLSAGGPCVLLTPGGSSQNEIQTLTIRASGGTFNLGYDAESETGIAYNVNAATLGGILEELTGLELETDLDEGFTLTGVGSAANPFRITYSTEVSASLLTADGSSLTGGGIITPLTVVPAVPGVDEIQVVHVDPFAIGGSIRVLKGTTATAAILYNDASDVWTTRLTAAFGVGTAVATGIPTAMQVRFAGSAGKQPQPLLTINQDSLQVSASQLTYAVTQQAAGGNWFNDGRNWTLGHAPNSGEVAVIGSGKSVITQGLIQASECEFSGEQVILPAGDFVPGQIVRFRTTGSFPSRDGEMPGTGPEQPSLNISTVVNGAGAATDSFTDANSTAIADHTSETGHTWLAPAVGSAVINDNKLRVTAPPAPSNPPTVVFLDGNFGADATVSLKRDTVPTAAGRYGIMLRYLDADNYVAALCIANGSQFGLTPGILKREAGEDDWMGSLGTGQTATVLQMSVTMTGNNFSFTTDDGTSSQTTTATTSFLAGNEKRGIYCYGNYGGSSAVVDFDNFSCSIAEGSDEIQSVWTDAEAGEFTLTDPDNDETSAGIPFDASAEVVQSELEDVYGAGNVAVTGAGTEASPWLIAFQGEKAATALPEMTGDNSGLEYVYAEGMSPSTDYYVLAATPGLNGSQVLLITDQPPDAEERIPLIFEDAGTGIHRVAVQLKALQIYARYAGQIGLPRRTTAGDWNPEPRALTIDFEDPTDAKPNLEIGVGVGNGSQRINIEAGPAWLDARVIKSGSGNEEPAIQIGNNNLANSELLVIAGQIGLAIEPTAQVALRRIVAFSGTVLVGNLDYSHLEDYMKCVTFVNSQANANVVQMRTR